ncbi:ephrin type-B receptor 1-B [Saccoglossus kowalevskii]|uniref:receptor protein-tyrosine kinase n=1 Tax=Saccoglossus kowalevskii TaxID=10224 RepID=A0ABM0MME6_SACKO|nr:PREDICTED: ephrin type-B receptor 2 [Saccoglossus kowalevskii]
MATTGFTLSPTSTLFLTVFLAVLTLTVCLQVPLYNSQDQRSLGWTTYHETSSVQPEWTETGPSGGRRYQICRFANGGRQNNWLRTTWIDAKQANRVAVEIDFSMRECVDIPGAVSCKETFDLYYYETDSDNADQNWPPWSSPPYNKVDRIAADGRFTHDTEVINTKTRHFGPITRNGFYLAFQDQGSCLAILKLKVYYLACQEITMNFAYFPKTPAGPKSTALVQVTGDCIDFSQPIGPENPVYQCQSDGTWTLIDGSCACSPGYEATSDRACQACFAGEYKVNIGNSACKACPAQSYSLSQASAQCLCTEGYYRANKDPVSDPCTAPPSEPTGVRATVSESSVVTLFWNRPHNTGGRIDIFYRIECELCHGDQCQPCSYTVQYSPTQYGLTSSSVNISRLDSYTEYRFKVYAENGVSRLSGIESYATVNATTSSAVPSTVRAVRVTAETENTIELQWLVPEFPNGEILEYEIRYHPQAASVEGSKYQVSKPSNTGTQNAIVSQLEPGTDYSFEIRARTEAGFGVYSYPTTAKTSGGTSVPIEAIAGSIAAVVIILILAILIIFIIMSRRRKGYELRDTSTVYTNGEVLLPPSNKGKTYIDPHTYEDLNLAVKEFAKEISATYVKIEEVIGGGEFGDVCRGMLKMPRREPKIVAVKTLKPGASLKDRNDFLTEASIMGQFDDPNVIRLEGVITKSRPVLIVIEYMENGSLDRFLRNNDGKFTVIQLVGMLRGIACGMRYLSEMNYVHRDLAARNILINHRLVCKVADFGLSRIKEEGAYETKGGKIPIRWTAPEAIAYKKFTSASDVWSYGIVMWEVMSYGERPYWNWSNRDVIKSVEKGYRLPPPMDCPQALHQLMLDTWQKDRINRPTFLNIVNTLDRLIRNPSTLKNIIKARPYNPLDPSTPDMTQFRSVAEWLESIKMGRYINAFAEAGYLKLDDVVRLMLHDLPRIGITLVGHQKKIMNSIQALRTQMGKDNVIPVLV